MSRSNYHLQAAGFFLTVAIVSAAVAAAIFYGTPEKTVTASEVVTVEVAAVHLTTKTNSSVDLKVVGRNLTYRNIGLHCSTSEAKNVRIGSKWDVWTEDYKRGDRYGTDVKGVGAICDKSN